MVIFSEMSLRALEKAMGPVYAPGANRVFDQPIRQAQPVQEFIARLRLRGARVVFFENTGHEFEECNAPFPSWPEIIQMGNKPGEVILGWL